MKTRCYSARHNGFYLYGGRGIAVCDRWRTSFANFLSDMGERPSRTHSLDRIDSDGNYEPGNCRWATVHEQQRNRRNNKLNEVKVRRVFELVTAGYFLVEVAAMFEVSRRMITEIIAGRSWSAVAPEARLAALAARSAKP